ncbi:Aspartate carbamoyltransferase [Thermodesulfobium narugense DSM 14796]|uniref:Aspartate carbamoyltransferase n=1 Tax=Thermodesulfobium narugense DSM 14796 TaxID=747365 RepID=M1E794_9BACT|nr:aspartate carbamoyltransferase catalytic subunit [Thermodesulfobium narugense]AEE14360.1 Aspartate carbamoyltransferase [Thermodesulfobium narugense DSM 14796]
MISHLLSTRYLDLDEVLEIFDNAKKFLEVLNRPTKKIPILKGKLILTVFFEPSTRTRTSFEIAGKTLGADVINLSVSQSSAKKGETIKDTCLTLNAMKPDCIVLRHSVSKIPEYITNFTSAKVINAGDGSNEHPSQALLDAFTLMQHFKDLKDKKILILGDVLNSRVARSNIWLLKKFGAKISLCGPSTLVREEFEKEWDVDVYWDLDKAITNADAIIVLRIQLERAASAWIPSTREYSIFYGLNREKLMKNSNVIIMHPGPMNRGLEISSDVADGRNALIRNQVTNGVAIRMSIFYHLLAHKTGNIGDHLKLN